MQRNAGFGTINSPIYSVNAAPFCILLVSYRWPSKERGSLCLSVKSMHGIGVASLLQEENSFQIPLFVSKLSPRASGRSSNSLRDLENAKANPTLSHLWSRRWSASWMWPYSSRTKGFRIWDAPGPPASPQFLPYPTPDTSLSRVATMETGICTGITFFILSAVTYAIHEHTLNTVYAHATFERLSSQRQASAA
ncbi:hypothetical protein TOPH_05024 [Tolypocladium ophioglossoides CBS 100239]|uniref:Uncharacterized protein n=1 Tax=Tolypocladium ophioglossoides (strain CBS 100239) TaxID=1163406 RepID=A0A0L0N8W1_TOLOC|nr:hypothetical protein TOPH_05024 [Tolypocladium ophioglossoides CBS 100239]